MSKIARMRILKRIVVVGFAIWRWIRKALSARCTIHLQFVAIGWKLKALHLFEVYGLNRATGPSFHSNNKKSRSKSAPNIGLHGGGTLIGIEWVLSASWAFEKSQKCVFLLGGQWKDGLAQKKNNILSGILAFSSSWPKAASLCA